MVTKTTEELDEMRQMIREGKLPADAIEKHFEAEAKNVFGADATKDRKGNFVEQGIGSKGHETANHFAALLKAERDGYEPQGSYENAVKEIWKRDPKRAEKLRLPRPDSFSKAA